MKDITRKHLKADGRRPYSSAPEGKPMARHTGIRKLSNGRFRARYFKGYDIKTGKRVYPAKTFDTEREAREWRAEHISGRGLGLVEGRGITLTAYLDHWLTTKLNIRENTRYAYEQSLNNYVKPRLGRIKLSRLSPSDIEQWQKELLDSGLSQTTVQSARTVLFGALESAKLKNIVKLNAVELTAGPGRKKPDLYAVSVEEALRFIPACEGVRFGLLFLLAIQTGLRPEELVGLQWADLDLSGARGVVHVRRVLHHLKGGGWRWHEPKTKSSARRIVFPADLVTKLLEHRRAQLEQKLKAGKFWQNNDLVFPTSYGAPVRQAALFIYFKKALECAGLPRGIRVYDLRHAFVTFSLVAGVDAKTVSAEAGHKDVAFTLTRYGHVLDEMHEKAADKREDLLRSRRKN